MVLDLHAWTTAEQMILATSKPSWVSGLDAIRLAAYALYEGIYWNVDEAFRLQRRGSDEDPLYIPAPRSVVETVHRYLANDLVIVIDEEATAAPEGEAQAALAFLDALLRRERFYSKFEAAKRFGIIRGDWLIHVVGDDTRSQGSRISIFFIDPGSYFPIVNEDNVDEVIGCNLIDLIELDDRRQYVRRLQYRKTTGRSGPSPIEMSVTVHRPDRWGGPGQEVDIIERVLTPPTTLPEPIDQLPVYHIRNFEQPGELWGSSELRGIERLLTRMNQTVSDEDLALALESLGVYTTTAGPPIDPDTGEDLGWNIGPGRVIERPDGTDFSRVPGISSVQPFQDHLAFLERWLDKGTGLSDVAQGGHIGVEVAESGVALMLRMGPTLARVGEKERHVTDILTQLLFDLRRWIVAYENVNLENVIWTPTYGDKLPVNRTQRIKEVLEMFKAKLVSGSWARDELSKYGYEFPEDAEMTTELMAEQQLQTDVTDFRLGQELEEGVGAP